MATAAPTSTTLAAPPTTRVRPRRDSRENQDMAHEGRGEQDRSHQGHPGRAKLRNVGRMTNLPFGFSNSGDDDPEGKPGQGPGPGGFDLGQLGSMLSQLGQMMSQANASGTSSGPVNYDLARRLATSQVPASHPASSVDVNKVAEAIKLAEVWLDGATALPAGARTSTAWTPRQWIDATMPMWEKLCSPIAEQVSRAWVDGLPEQAKAQAGPLLAM